VAKKKSTKKARLKKPVKRKVGIDWENNTETCDFWIGYFPDETVFSRYVGEDPDFYQQPDEGTMPLSPFAGEQGEHWYDHDMIEMGFKANAATVAELVEGYSYHEQYADELATRAKAAGLAKCNAFLFIRVGEIDEPRSVKSQKFVFRYVGEITYKI
jgi:hypothetical protein